MAVGEWTPEGPTVPDADDLRAAAARWRECGEDAVSELSRAPDQLLRGTMTLPRGALDQAASSLEPADLDALVRLFTLLESRAGWEAGERSPVVPLFRELKRRIPKEEAEALAAWVKAHADNRFLPHGSLQDRLQEPAP